MDFTFIQQMTNAGLRVFNVEQATRIGIGIGIQPSAVKGLLHRLNKKKIIERLKRGLYSLAPEFLRGIPIHEYEIALTLGTPSAIAYLSAFSYHKLTDQISSHFYIITLEELRQHRSSYYTYTIKGLKYRIVYVKKNHFFGIDKKWLAGASIEVTDLERTLIDGLMKPKYCGGFREVLYAFSQAIERIDLDKIISYALKMNDTACKRLGWVLENLEIEQSRLEPLLARTTTSFSTLDQSGSRCGVRNNKWLIVQNI